MVIGTAYVGLLTFHAWLFEFSLKCSMPFWDDLVHLSQINMLNSCLMLSFVIHNVPTTAVVKQNLKGHRPLVKSMRSLTWTCKTNLFFYHLLPRIRL